MIEVRESGQMLCSPEGGCTSEGSEEEGYLWHFKGVFTPLNKNSGQGLLTALVNLL